MDLEARKISFIQEFLRLQNEQVISSLEQLLRKERAQLMENDLKPMTLREYKDDIDKAMDDSKNGRMTKAEELKAGFKKWS